MIKIKQKRSGKKKEMSDWLTARLDCPLVRKSECLIVFLSSSRTRYMSTCPSDRMTHYANVHYSRYLILMTLSMNTSVSTNIVKIPTSVETNAFILKTELWCEDSCPIVSSYSLSVGFFSKIFWRRDVLSIEITIVLLRHIFWLSKSNESW